MKLFWKLFFTTMIVSVLSLTVGEYLLIRNNLEMQIDNEVQMAYDLGDVVYYSLSNELELPSEKIAEKDAYTEDIISNTAASMNINSMNQRVAFCILSENGIVYSSLPSEPEASLLDDMDRYTRNYTIREENGKTYIWAVRPIQYDKSMFYIMTIRDISHIYDGQKNQYKTIVSTMFGILLITAIVTLSVSKLLTKRIVALSKVTREISEGYMDKRAMVNGADEITSLSLNFNKMADDLSEKMDTLQDEAHRKELFVGAFSHELKTPLTSIIGYSDMIRRKDMDKEQLHISAEYIFSEGKRLEHLSMRLMDLIVLNNTELELLPVDIESIVEDTVAFMKDRLIEQNIHISTRIYGKKIMMEYDLMKTVIINLIDNARKAIENDGEIMILGEEIDGTYRLSVQDTGKGMEAKDIARIKEAFYMVDKSRSRKQGGSGLGLAICDEIVSLHGFELEYKSEVGVGTTATIVMKGEQNE